MTEQAKAARREYKREWNRRNKDKVKASQDRYWAKKAAASASVTKPRATETTAEA